MKPIELTREQRQKIDRRRKASHDRRLYERLTAVLAVAAGKSRVEVADLLGVRLTQRGEWLRLFRNRGLDALCTLHHKGDPGNLTGDWEEAGACRTLEKSETSPASKTDCSATISPTT